jgi:hypothetical protein
MTGITTFSIICLILPDARTNFMFRVQLGASGWARKTIENEQQQIRATNKSFLCMNQCIQLELGQCPVESTAYDRGSMKKKRPKAKEQIQIEVQF